MVELGKFRGIMHGAPKSKHNAIFPRKGTSFHSFVFFGVAEPRKLLTRRGRRWKDLGQLSAHDPGTRGGCRDRSRQHEELEGRQLRFLSRQVVQELHVEFEIGKGRPDLFVPL
jgi:hypothetical protein